MPGRRAVGAWLSFALLLGTAGGAGAQGTPVTEKDKPALAELVRREFLFSWNAYKTYAWGHDELAPLSKTRVDWYGAPLYLTAVDALDTLILMGFKDQAEEARRYIDSHLSFDQDAYVSVFEITIRVLGGLLSSYQTTGDPRLLALARDLANREMPAFHSTTGMPYGDVNLRTGAVRRPVTNPAEVGTLLLEFGALSKLTGNPAYYAAAKNACQQVFLRRSRIGLVGQAIDVRTGRWASPTSHIGGGIDSYYEYLVKGARLFDDPDLSAMAAESLRAVDRYVADPTRDGLWYGKVNMDTGARLERVFGALECYFPGLLVLSGNTAMARALEDSCFAMWNRFGVEPEQYDYSTGTAVSPQYYLRPEIMESAFYLYRDTADPKYLTMGRVFLSALQSFCRTDAGYTELSDVVSKTKADHMPSYFLAETLKYLYLLFAPPQTLDLKKVVLTTEAHPLRKDW